MSADLTTQDVRRSVGSYLLEEEIGRGGMGVVYRATRVDTGETVAVKLMLPEIAANNHFRARFVREASLGSDLDHPNIVPIYDAGEDAGSLFIAMRLVEGRDLKTLIEEEGPLDPKRLVSLMRQVAAALDAAHESGLVHHDVKPQNILLDTADATGETAYVTDFGLVRPAGKESTASRTGQVFGSIQYMAPEQVEGMPADGRADVYALGCVLFECLTGQIPFDRPNEVAVLWAHVHEAPARVTDLRPELPGGVDAVVARAMAKHPDDRYLTCGELVEELEKGLDRKHRPVVMPIVRPLVKRIPRAKTEREVWAPNYFPELSRVRKVSERVNWVQVAAVTSILSLLAAALVQFAHPGGVRGAVTDVATAVGTKILDAGVKVSSAFGNDEESPPLQSVDDHIRRRRASSGDPVRLASSGGEERVFGSQRRDLGERHKRSVDLLVEPTNASRDAQAAMRHAMLFSAPIPANVCCDYGIYTMRPNGGRVRLLHNTPVDELDPEWSDDQSQIAFVRDRDIYVMDSDGSSVRRVTVGSGTSRDPSWSPDGTQIVFSYGTGQASELYIVDVRGSSIGIPRQLTRNSAVCVSCSSRQPDWAPDGSKIVFSLVSEDSSSLATIHPDGSGLSTGLTSSAGVSSPTWSPDGSRIAYVAGRPTNRRLHVFESARAGVTKIDCGWACAVPTWSPDGASVAFTAGDQRRDIYVVDAGGNGSRSRILADVAAQTTIDWR